MIILVNPISVHHVCMYVFITDICGVKARLDKYKNLCFSKILISLKMIFVYTSGNTLNNFF